MNQCPPNTGFDGERHMNSENFWNTPRVYHDIYVCIKSFGPNSQNTLNLDCSWSIKQSLYKQNQIRKQLHTVKPVNGLMLIDVIHFVLTFEKILKMANERRYCILVKSN